jgi:hypothetical protein
MQTNRNLASSVAICLATGKIINETYEFKDLLQTSHLALSNISLINASSEEPMAIVEFFGLNKELKIYHVNNVGLKFVLRHYFG